MSICLFSHMRGISSAGRVFGWQPKGQGFDPPMLHISARNSLSNSLVRIAGLFFILTFV